MDKGQFGSPNELPHFDPLTRAVASASAAAVAALGPEYASARGGVLVLSSLAFQGQGKKRSAETGELMPGSWAPLPGGSHRWECAVPPQWPAAGEAACCSSFDRSWRLPETAMLEHIAAAAGVAAPPPASNRTAAGGVQQQPPDSGILFVGSGQQDRDAAAAAGCAFCDAGKLLGGLRYHPEWPMREWVGAAENASSGAGGSGASQAVAGKAIAASWWMWEWDEAEGKPVYYRKPT
jgi:hypothetical protein